MMPVIKSNLAEHKHRLWCLIITMVADDLGPILLTWFNLNPNMDK